MNGFCVDGKVDWEKAGEIQFREGAIKLFMAYREGKEFKKRQHRFISVVTQEDKNSWACPLYGVKTLWCIWKES